MKYFKVNYTHTNSHNSLVYNDAYLTVCAGQFEQDILTLGINFTILTSCRLDMSCLGIVTFITANHNCADFLMARFITTIYGRLRSQ